MVRRRFAFVLPLSAALLVAAALGVQLGRSAISEIDPVHFRGAARPPRAIDPAAARPAADAFASAYGWSEGDRARFEECGGDCDALQARQAMVVALAAQAPVRRADAPYWRDATPTTELMPWKPGETGGRALNVERYMHYPIARDPAETAEDEPAADDGETGED